MIDDPILRALPLPEPDATRAARLRARCHARLARGVRQRERTVQGLGLARRVLAPALTGAICLLYVVAVLDNALQVLGLFQP